VCTVKVVFFYHVWFLITELLTHLIQEVIKLITSNVESNSSRYLVTNCHVNVYSAPDSGKFPVLRDDDYTELSRMDWRNTRKLSPRIEQLNKFVLTGELDVPFKNCQNN
jgi:hypothetical protein